MKRWGLFLVIILATAALLISGCGDGEEATPTPAPPTATATPVVTPTPAPTQAPLPGELEELLGKTAGIESVRYDMAMTAPGLPDTTSTVWQKGGKSKTETSVMDQITITYTDYDAQMMCTCFQATGMCMGMDFSQAPADPVEQSEYIEQFNPTIVGSEVMNGKDCLVFEWTAEGVHTKWWLDKDSGWPVRVETTTPQGKAIIDYTNIEFVDIDDSEFEFPAECAQ